MTVGGMNFNFLVDYLLNDDPFMCLADFESYIHAQQQIEEAYNHEKQWQKMSLVNTAKAGIFSADRAVKEYADRIWHIQQVNRIEMDFSEVAKDGSSPVRSHA